MRHDTEIACDFIDSAMFTGDEFMNTKAVEELEHYIDRWSRELVRNRKAILIELRKNKD